MNHFTKEYYWVEEGNEAELGWIGWKYLPENEIDGADKKYKNLGYKEPINPAKIELGIIIVGLLVETLFFRIKRKAQVNVN